MNRGIKLKKLFYSVSVALLAAVLNLNSSTLKAAEDSIATENNIAFSFDLYQQIKDEKINMIVSPYSLLSALIMAYEGANGKTKAAMQSALHLLADKPKMRAEYLSLYHKITGQNKFGNDDAIVDIAKNDRSFKFNIANTLWVQNDFPLIKEYQETVSKYYHGYVSNFDFKKDSRKASAEINAWISKKTNNMIQNTIMPGMLNKQTRLLIANAIYFKANWDKQFTPQETRTGRFKINSTQQVEVEMMHATDLYRYAETEEIEMLEMDYKGKALSMLVILPKKNNIINIENIISRNKLYEWKSKMSVQRVRLAFPKFKANSKYILNDKLDHMGMGVAFLDGAADFRGISDRSDLALKKSFIKRL